MASNFEWSVNKLFYFPFFFIEKNEIYFLPIKVLLSVVKQLTSGHLFLINASWPKPNYKNRLNSNQRCNIFEISYIIIFIFEEWIVK